MKKLLYINNYNCSLRTENGTPVNHLWGVDELNHNYDVICASVPPDVFRIKFKGSYFINNFIKSFLMLMKYRRCQIVYAACGDLTMAFALANILHLGKRNLYMIQHHGDKKIPFTNGYSKIIFISKFVYEKFSHFNNTICIDWGGCIDYANRFKNDDEIYTYDFISAGKSGRDYNCMIKAANKIKAKTIIVTSVNKITYDSSKITIISGNDPNKNSSIYDNVYKLYAKSKFIVIPIEKRLNKRKYSLAGLTSFVDAVVMEKPVLISDNTNMGIDVEKLGLGFTYKAGNEEDMINKMNALIELPRSEYNLMCKNMKDYSLTHNYSEFCRKLLGIIK